MAIYKRGKRYWFEFEQDGKRYQRSAKTSSRREAEGIERAFRTALAKGDVGITPRKTVPGFQTAMADFLKWSKVEHADKPATYDRYRYSSKPLVNHFQNVALDKITSDEVDRYKRVRLHQRRTTRIKGGRKMGRGHIKPATVNRELACLRMVFNHAIKSKIALENPIQKNAAKLMRENNEQTRVLTLDEQAKYLASASPMLHDVAAIILETGMRPEEVFRILPENVCLDKGTLYNPHGKTKAARRWIRLTAAAQAVLARRLKNRKGLYLFAHKKDPNKPLPNVHSAHRRARKASGVAHFRLYDCRHTWATRAVEAGIDLVTLAAMLGHSKIAMVLRYAHPTQEHQAKAMEKMEQYVAAQQIEAVARQQRIAEMTIQ